jgi:hypothetical protein
MKKLAIILVTFVSAFSVAKSQAPSAESESSKGPEREITYGKETIHTLPGKFVNDESKRSFETDFPSVKDAEWSRLEAFDQAVFTLNGRETTAFYDSEANLVGTTSARVLTDLPDKAQKEIKEKYSDYVIGPIIFFNDNALNETDMILWATQFDDEDLYFVQLNKGDDKIVLKVNPTGDVSLFKKL